MPQPTDSPYLTVAQVAETLGMTPDGVYKLISRNKLPAVRRSERGLRVTRWALEAYRESLNDSGPDTSLPQDAFDASALRARFEAQTGMSPEEWVAAWRRDEIADSAENNARLVQALALREHGEHGAAVGRERWAVAAFADRGV